MTRNIKFFVLVSFCFIGSALGDACSQGPCMRKRKVFRNLSGEPVIGLIKITQPCESGQRLICRDFRTREINNGAIDVIDLECNAVVKEVSFAYTTTKKHHVKHVFDNDYQACDASEFILKPLDPKDSSKPWGKIEVYECDKSLSKCSKAGTHVQDGATCSPHQK